jgi:hypothetical protein
MHDLTFSGETKKHRRWLQGLAVAFIVAALGMFFLSPTPSALASSPSDCHRDGNAHLLSSPTHYTIVYAPPGTFQSEKLGDMLVSLYYCPSYQSVFVRFEYTGTNTEPGIYQSLAGNCYLTDYTRDQTTTDGSSCNNPMTDGQFVDSRIVYGPGDTWAGSWGPVNANVYCVADDGQAWKSCSTAKATAYAGNNSGETNNRGNNNQNNRAADQ